MDFYGGKRNEQFFHSFFFFFFLELNLFNVAQKLVYSDGHAMYSTYNHVSYVQREEGKGRRKGGASSKVRA